jgi:xanthine dehydrogenase accessory factor
MIQTAAALVLKHALARVEAGEACAIAQIVRVNGSIPNGLGAKMLVDARGVLIAGTVGGGQIEFRALEAARDALADGQSRLLTAKLTDEEAGGIGMRCGGQVDIFIDVLLPPPRLVLCGAGHIHRALARMTTGLELRVTVIDDRPEWASRENYPDAEVIVAPPEEALASLALDARDFVVVGTRGGDLEVVLAAAKTRAHYIGLVASTRKAVLIAKELAARSDPDFTLGALLPRLHAPVGLALGGRTPEAVALSILAEIQALRSGGSAQPMRVTPEELACLTAPTPSRS